MLSAIGIGDCVCDQYRNLNLMFPGGQALNFAVYCKKLHCRSAFLGVLGDDAVAEHIKHTMSALEIDFSHSRMMQGANGYAVVDIMNGERVFVYSNKGGVTQKHPIELTSCDLDYISQFDLIHTSNNSYIDSQLPKLKALPGKLSYDFSDKWKENCNLKHICHGLDFAFLSSSDKEEDIILQAKKMHQLGTKLTIITRGEKGSVVYDGVHFYKHPIKPIEAVDTLGAGDSMAAAFLVCFMAETKNNPPKPGSITMKAIISRALESGSQMAQQTCMMYGAFGHGIPIP